MYIIVVLSLARKIFNLKIKFFDKDKYYRKTIMWKSKTAYRQIYKNSKEPTLILFI